MGCAMGIRKSPGFARALFTLLSTTIAFEAHSADVYSVTLSRSEGGIPFAVLYCPGNLYCKRRQAVIIGSEERPAEYVLDIDAGGINRHFNVNTEKCRYDVKGADEARPGGKGTACDVVVGVLRSARQ